MKTENLLSKVDDTKQCPIAWPLISEHRYSVYMMYMNLDNSSLYAAHSPTAEFTRAMQQKAFFYFSSFCKSFSPSLAFFQ